MIRRPSLVPLLFAGAVALCGCPKKPAVVAPTPEATTPTPAASPTPEARVEAPFDPLRLEPISARSQTARIPVLMFHDVVKRRDVSWDCTVDELKEMLDWLDEQGAHYLSLEELHRHLVHGDAVPPGSIVLTFDDNYQGFHDNAYPILKARKIPSAMFVHTDFVGNTKKTKHNMDWETLRKLDAEGLVTIASHTCSHPEDLTKLDLGEQESELNDSKAILEREIGHPIPYFAYPVGKGDAETFAAAERAGYTMAFTMDNGPAEESPSILTVHRYIQSRYRTAWKECAEAAQDAPAAIVEQRLQDGPVTLTVGTYDGIRLAMVKGGRLASVRDPNGARKSVGEYIRDNEGAVAGMNGTFFVNAALRGTDNAMIGPFRAQNEPQFFSDRDPTRLPKLLNRPLVAWGPTTIAIAPFNPSALNDEDAVKRFLPEMTDCFLAGAWIVHNGEARSRAQMSAYSARDFNDPRKRAFFGIDASGQVVLGASRDVITTEMMARGAAAAGVQEAVLMDSGFSTSIVYNGKVIVTGHSAKNLASRVVPHALVVRGELNPVVDGDAQKVLDQAEDAVGKISAADAQAQAPGPDSSPRRRRRRH